MVVSPLDLLSMATDATNHFTLQCGTRKVIRYQPQLPTYMDKEIQFFSKRSGKCTIHFDLDRFNVERIHDDVGLQYQRQNSTKRLRILFPCT